MTPTNPTADELDALLEWAECDGDPEGVMRRKDAKILAAAYRQERAAREKCRERVVDAHRAFHEVTRGEPFPVSMHGPDGINPADFVRKLAGHLKDAQAEVSALRSRITELEAHILELSGRPKS